MPSRSIKITEAKICVLLALDELGGGATLGEIRQRSGNGSSTERTLLALSDDGLVTGFQFINWRLTPTGKIKVREIADTPLELSE